MEISTKNRLLFWALILLIVLNLSVLVTVYILPKGPAPADCEAMRPRAGRALQKELGLSPDQLSQIDIINDDYYNRSEPLVSSIRSIRGEIMDELAGDSPDMTLVGQKSAEISHLQQQVQLANFEQYLALKQICTPEQAQRLSALYRELYGCPVRIQNNGKLHRHRYGGQ